MLVQVRWETTAGVSNVLRSSFKTVAEAVDKLVPKSPDVKTVAAFQVVNPEDPTRLFGGKTGDVAELERRRALPNDFNPAGEPYGDF